MKTWVWFLVFAFLSSGSLEAYAQQNDGSFYNYQFSSERVSKAWGKYNTLLKKEFLSKQLHWPPVDIHLRAFKSQNEMELWARNNNEEAYRKIKTYRICAVSGSLGPKRKQGDKQIPEGFYFIEDSMQT